MEKLAIIGSRTFNDYNLLKEKVDKILSEYRLNIKLIISGGAKGADSLAEQYAKEKGIEILIIKPNWDLYKKAAGFIRNADIINNSDIVIAFWNGISNGTKDSIAKAQKSEKTVFIEYI